jgi:hypothetical protein
MAYTLTIGGVDKTDSIAEDSLVYENALGQRDVLSFRVISADGTYKPAIGAPVVFSVDGTARFGGNIRQLSTQQFGAALISTVGCASWEQLFDRRPTGVRTYTNETAGAIFTDLLTNCMGGDGVSSSIVVTGPVIPSAVFDFATVREAFDYVCALASDDADTYMWDCTPAKVVRFYRSNSFHAPFDITASSEDVLHVGGSVRVGASWSLDRYANRAYVKLGKFVRDAEAQSFTIGSDTQFTVDYPIAKVPVVKVDTVEKTVGILDVDTGKDWYWQDGSPVVTRDAGGSGGTSVEITYQGYESKVVGPVQNDTEVDARAAAEGGTGYYTDVLESSDPATSADATNRLQSHLDKVSRIPCVVEYPTQTDGVRAGMWQSINLPEITVNDAFLIESVTMQSSVGLWSWKVKAIAGALTGDYKTRLRELKNVGGGSASGTPGPQGPPGPTATAPGSVTIDAITVTGNPRRYHGAGPSAAVNALSAAYYNVAIAYTAPSSDANFRGVYVEIEAPDQSTGTAATLDGTTDLDGTRDLSGPKAPQKFGPFAYSETGGLVTVSIQAPDAALLPMDCRARLVSYSDAIVNDSATAPSDTFTLGAAAVPKPDSATAYCLNPTITVDPATETNDGSGHRTHVLIHMTPPADQHFVGAVYTLVTESGGVVVTSGVESGAVFDLAFRTPNWSGTCTLYAPGSDGTHTNPIVPGITPSATVEIGLGKPSATAIMTAGADAVITVRGPNGEQDWAVPSVYWTDKGHPTNTPRDRTIQGDVRAHTTWLTAQMVDASGNPAPDEQGGREVLVAMEGYTWSSHETQNIRFWGYQPAGSIYTYLQLRLYVGNRAASGYGDTENATVQTCWSGADYLRLNIGDAPAGEIPANRIDPGTLGNLEVDAGTQKLNVKITGPLYEDVAHNINLRIGPDYVISGAGTVGDPYKLSQAIVNLALAANFDTTNFEIASGSLKVKSIAVDSLIAGNALFAGDATFARVSGGKVTINSAGIALSDHLTTPTATMTVTSTGCTLVKGSNSLAVTATGMQFTDSNGNSLTASSTGLVVSRGSSSVTVASSGVAIVNGAFDFNSGGVVLSIKPAISTPIGTVSGSMINSGSLYNISTSSATILCGASGSSGPYASISQNGIVVSSGGATQCYIGYNIFQMSGLRSTNPGAGTKELWYDPADGNRVKFAA